MVLFLAMIVCVLLTVRVTIIRYKATNHREINLTL